MRLSFIGMAQTGKSYWSMKLAEKGFKRFGCDDMIAEKLAPALKRPDGSMMNMGEWMGFPHESQYKERESKYLAYEIQVLSEIFDLLESGDSRPEGDTVIDTTGSVIYTGEAVLKRLTAATTVVHLSTPREVQEKMLKAYLANPGPLLWRDMFVVRPEETREEALARCYERLMVTREERYKQYAHVTIDYYKRKQDGFGADDLLVEIGKGM